MQLELLEPRLAPAGIVTISVTGTTLTITGDAADNNLTLDQAQGGLQITGLDSTSIQYQGALLNGPLSLAQVIKSITIDLKGGNDGLTLDDVHLTGALAANVGAGDNNLTVHGGAFAGGIKVTASSGNDQVTMQNTLIAGAASIALGDGDNTTLLQATGADITDLTFGKGLSYTGGLGQDSVTLIGQDSIHIDGSGLSLSLGGGLNEARLTTHGLLQIHGGFTSTSGAQPKPTTAGSPTASGPIGTDLKVDSWQIDISGSVAVRNQYGPLSMAFGVGDSYDLDRQIETGGSVTHIGGNFSLTNSANIDGSSFALQGFSTVIGGNLSLSMGSGATATVIQGGRDDLGILSVGGGLTIAHGDGINASDTIKLQELAAGGKLTLSGGSGAITHSLMVGRLHAGGGIAISHAAAGTAESPSLATSASIIAEEIIAPSITVTNGKGVFSTAISTIHGSVTGNFLILNGDNPSPDTPTVDSIQGDWEIGGNLEFQGGSGGIVETLSVPNHLYIGKDLKVTSRDSSTLAASLALDCSHVEVGGDITIRHANGAYSAYLGNGYFDVADDLNISVGNAAPGLTNVFTLAGVWTLGGDYTFRGRVGEYAHQFAGRMYIAGGISITNGRYQPGEYGQNQFNISGEVFSVGRSLLLNNSAGGNSNTAIDVDLLKIGGALTLLNGAGDDHLSLTTFDGRIQGGVFLRNGAGSSDTVVSTKFSGTLDIADGITVTSLAGDDVLSIRGGFNIAGGITANFGASQSIQVDLGAEINSYYRWFNLSGGVNLTASTNAARQISLTHAAVQGPLNLVGGSGADTVSLVDTICTGPVNVRLLAGDDAFSTTACTYRGALTLSMGDDADIVIISSNDGSHMAPSQFLGPVTLRLEGGDDSLTISEEIASAIFQNKALFDGGAGIDTIAVTLAATPSGHEPIFIGGPPTIKDFESP